MRFARTLSIAAVAAVLGAVAPARAQALGAPVAADRLAVQPYEFTPSPLDASVETAWRGLVFPPLSGGLVARLALAGADGLKADDGRVLIGGRLGFDSRSEGQIGVARDWPSALRLKTGSFGFDLTPHAGFTAGNSRDAQNAGAVLRFGRGLGLDNGQAGGRGKWFLFASADQEILGLGFMRNDDPWRRAGLGLDPGATIADTRAGVAWRSGPFEASVGYLYREIKPHDLDMIDAQSNRESSVALRLSFHPGARR